jgi:UDP-N-acetylmuramate: L-alanyl-gamma-D-glutamyl-meso-diaminopimelate ligase
LRDVKHIHFLGIAGTAMGSVAVMASNSGFIVTGSDNAVYLPMSGYLEKKNINFFNGYDRSNLNKSIDLVIVGNAISRGNSELEEVLNQRIAYCSLPEFLRFYYLQKTTNICIAGTHGKTTTSAMTTFCFEKCGLKPGYFIGGVPVDFETSARKGDDYFILESDEYDTAYFDKRSKFLHYLPRMGLINNIEFDHADIFNNIDEIKLSFKRFAKLIPQNGYLLYNADCKSSTEVAQESLCYRESFGFGDNSTWKIDNIKQQNEFQSFDLIGPDLIMKEILLSLPGEHMISNAAAALILSLHAGLDPTQLNYCLKSFNGVARRAEKHVLKSGAVFIDDFAHHPTAINKTLRGFKGAYPERKIAVLVEPRSNTMIRSLFAEKLVDSLSIADEIIFAPLHRAEKIPEQDRLPIKEMISNLKRMEKGAAQLDTQQEFIKKIHEYNNAQFLIIMLSNGSFLGLKEKILSEF